MSQTRMFWIIIIPAVLSLCSCRAVKVVNPPHSAAVKAIWISHSEIRITNRGKTPVENVQVWVRYWQDHVPPHTMGYAQHEIPRGWYENVVNVMGVLQPGHSRTVRARKSIRRLGRQLHLPQLER